MKIALIGTFGTGKTTLAHELIAKLKKKNINAEFLGETARTCPFPINELITKKAQEWIIYAQYLREIEAENKCDLLICDRSVLDGYAYYVHKFDRKNYLEEFIKEKIKEYQLLFMVPIKNSYLKPDGVRSMNTVFQKEVDETFKYLLSELNIPFNNHECLSKTLEKITKVVN
jgi:nicotinamide riboside kinase